jgi:hypothetical protein
MKKLLKMIVIAVCVSFSLSSCYKYNVVVGKGAQGNEVIKKHNHYLIGGLAPIHVSDPKQMAGTSTDYTVTTWISFLDGLLSGITYGIYSPSTTTVRK